MTVEIDLEPSFDAAAYAAVPIAFQVRERFVVSAPEAGLAGLHLAAERLPVAYSKDYDADPEHHPAAWAWRFDHTRWGNFAARAHGARVGGAVVALRTPGLDMLEQRDDLAVLWDLRVAPAMRGQGVGAALFRSAEAWALARGARWLKIETQNVNVAACRFYAHHGCVLGAVHRFAYPALPDEVQLLWYKQLAPLAGAS